MKRKRQARILLGILLAALLLFPGGMRIKAEEVVSGEQPAQDEQMPAEGLENIETANPEIKEPPPEGNEENLPEETEPEEPLLEEEEPVEPVQDEVPEESKKPAEENLLTPMTEEKKMPELDLKSFDCDFIWGVDYGDELFDFDCDSDVGSKIRWIGIEHILGMHIKFLPEIDVQCITVEKIWRDGGSKYRPFAVMFDLYANGTKVAVLPIVTNHTDYWKTKILVPKSVHGQDIEYTVKEVVHPDLKNYTTTVSGLKIINTMTRDITVEKLWKMDHEKVRPDSVSFWLMNGEEVVGEKRTLSSGDGWKVVIPDVPAYDADGKINYTIKEEVLVGYDSYVHEGCLEFNGTDTRTLDEKDKCCEDECPDFTIINTFTNEKEITLVKKWIDDDSEDRPDALTFILDNNDGASVEIPITSADGWEKEVTVEIADENWMYYDYMVDEKEVPEGYVKTIVDFTITNELMPVEMITIEGEKTWLDDGTGRPEFINVRLMADGELLETKKVMPIEGKWMYDFGMLPKYGEEMEEILYTVSEEPVEGYECIPGEGFDITNRRVGMITISGEKTWDDLMNRPSSITVYLEKEGEIFEEVEVKADDMGKWLYSFKETAQFDENGLPYTFTVSEKYILGYEANVTGFNIQNVQLRATMKVLKVNEADKPLAGAVFEVRDLSGKVLKTFTTDADGLFTMELPLGMYRLVEISPPTGYAKNIVPRLVILFNAGDVQTIKVVNSFDKPAIVPKPIPTYPVLPKTGSESEFGFYLFGAASVGLGLLTMKKKNNKRI
jgi:LPXTG-motif cell wall-anchored protein